MRRSAEKTIRNLEMRIARLERQATSNKTSAIAFEDLGNEAYNIWGILNGGGPIENGVGLLRAFLKDLNKVGTTEQIRSTEKVLKRFERQIKTLEEKKNEIEDLDKSTLGLLEHWAEEDVWES